MVAVVVVGVEVVVMTRDLEKVKIRFAVDRKCMGGKEFALLIHFIIIDRKGIDTNFS